ncbi:acyl-CoA dehydrogenase family protein [Nocardia macrotermitis]|uniref:Acyl-CoA dehydrogenase/oxidase C-terminal domain-containing protein n=1 Tax=Nocardia macrotermitis TaxID=2585198 RepID=A0A7K0DEY0_9NOCA|nr:acyl-CoA dehydrogenase family protein [Nocardia macrotermitis]MQY24199.1 hypothetical protein [Nocardia macrotermitis]
MTTADLPRPAVSDDATPPGHGTDLGPGPSEPVPTVAALRQMIFGEQWALQQRFRDVIAGLEDGPRTGLVQADEAVIGPELLRLALAQLGHSAREIAADHQLRGALCGHALVTAPHMAPILTGHFSLSTSAINRLGNGSRYQQDCLAELDTAQAIGLLCLTELGGTNGNDHRTIAEWDATTDGFWISSPTAEAWKFMPNAASAVPKTAVVTARLLVDGEDQGVLPFLFRLRTAEGLADGLEVVALPDKATTAMDHGIFRFTRMWVPRDALLGGDWAVLTPEGRFECAVPLRHRFHRAIGVLGDGRLDLANCIIAAARAGLAGLVNYSLQRRPGQGMLMADRDNVRLDVVSALAAVYATSVLGRRIRDLRSGPDADEHPHAVWSMIAKPLLTYTGLEVLTTCEQRAGAQGTLRSNLFADWIGGTKGAITAEGENRILQVKVGRPELEFLCLPGTPEQLPWYLDMLIHREHRIAASLRDSAPDPASCALGPESAAVEMADATSQRLAATALYLESVAATDPTAARLAESAAAAYALQCIHSNAAWFIAHEQMPRVAGELRAHRTVLLDHLTAMIEGFALPDLSFAPIFSEDYIDAYRKFTGWADSAAA